MKAISTKKYLADRAARGIGDLPVDCISLDQYRADVTLHKFVGWEPVTNELPILIQNYGNGLIILEGTMP